MESAVALFSDFYHHLEQWPDEFKASESEEVSHKPTLMKSLYGILRNTLLERKKGKPAKKQVTPPSEQAESDGKPDNFMAHQQRAPGYKQKEQDQIVEKGDKATPAKTGVTSGVSTVKTQLEGGEKQGGTGANASDSSSESSDEDPKDAH